MHDDDGVGPGGSAGGLGILGKYDVDARAKERSTLTLDAGGGAYRYWPRPQPTFLTLYGNVDVRQVDLAFNASGRLQELRKEEGDAVKTGETVAIMESDTYRDAVALARARLAAQRAVVDRLETGSRPEEIARDRAQVEANKAAVVDAELLLKRRTELLAGGNVSRQLHDEAKNGYDSARARLDISQQVSRLTEIGPRREDIEQAKALLALPERPTAIFASNDDMALGCIAAIAEAGRACGSCHRAAGLGPYFLDVPVPAEDDVMGRHVWAADRMWESLVGANDGAWVRARDVLGPVDERATHLYDDVPLAVRAEAAQYRSRLHGLAEAGVTGGDSERASIYGGVLETCVGCHSLLGGGPHAEPEGDAP